MVSKATLTKRIEFCASHRYYNPAWDEETNRRVFGPCVREHGHNYLLEVTLCGAIDPVTGMIINIYDLKQYLWEVLEEFDHKHLNLDTPYFRRTIPTTENVAHVLWHVFAQHDRIPALDRIRLYEDEELFAEVTQEQRRQCTSDGLLRASITRLYRFSSSHRTGSSRISGHDYVVGVTVHGPIHPETGQVVDLLELDGLVEDRVIRRFDGKELDQDPVFREKPVSEANLAGVIWRTLADRLRAECVSHVSVRATHRSEVSYVPVAGEPSVSVPTCS